MKLAVSNIAFPAREEPQAYALLQRYGFSGLEVAPSRLLADAEQPYENVPLAVQMIAALHERYGFVVPSLQSIWYGQTGNLFVAEDAARLAAYTAQAAGFAQALGCKSLVFGCPKQRVMPQSAVQEDAIAFFTQIAADAADKGCCIALEANPSLYGTNFCNTSGEAFAFARRVPHLRVNYDFGTLLANGESLQILEDNFEAVSHIHLSEPSLMPIVPHTLHRELAALLCARGYDGFVSVEMKAQPLAVLEPVLAYVSGVFA